MMEQIKPGNKSHTERIKPRTGALFQIQPWGFLERIEIRYPNPLPNMNTCNVHEFILERLPEGFEVFGVFRDVEKVEKHES